MTKIKVLALLIAAMVYSTVSQSAPVANQTLIKNYIPWLDSNDYRLIKNYEQRLKLERKNLPVRGTPEQILKRELALQSAVEFQAVMFSAVRTVSTEHVALFSTVSRETREKIPGKDVKLLYHEINTRRHLTEAGLSEQTVTGVIIKMFDIAWSGDENDTKVLEDVQIMLTAD